LDHDRSASSAKPNTKTNTKTDAAGGLNRLLSSRSLRLAVAAALLAYFLWISHPADIWAALKGARAWPIAGAIALTLFDRSLMAWRWLVLLRPVPPDQRPSLWRIMRIFFVSTFMGTFLPASVGGDVVRAYALSRERVPMSLSAASVAMDRALGVVSILLLGAASLVAAPEQAPPGVAIVMTLGTVACLGLAAVIFSERVAGWVAGLLGWLPGAAVRRLAGKLLEAVREYRFHHGALASVLAGSVAVQALRVLQAWLLGLGLGVTAPPAAYFVCIPLILLVMLLPITMNGLGTSQAAFVWCFGSLGVAPADAFALSILFVALGIVGNLPGGILYGLGRTGDEPGGQRLEVGD
jgi:uncharacterized protein (TIRG00374 family)